MADQFLELLQETIDRETPLSMDMPLSQIQEWDSLAAMAFIGLARNVYQKQLKLTDLENAVTISDIYALLS